MTFSCFLCSKSRDIKGVRMPVGWKKKGTDSYCSDCWKKMYMLRAISIPVSSPLSRAVDGEQKELSWDDLWASLKTMWKETTQCSNWMVSWMKILDEKRTAESAEKMPGMPKTYLYPEARQLFPNLPPQSVSCLEQSIHRKYVALRYSVGWTFAKSLPTFRYPTPFPVHNQSWYPSIEKDRPIIDIRIAGSYHRLQLKSGHQFGRQLKQFRQLVGGDAIKGEAAIYRSGNSIMVKLVAWLPRPATPKGLDGTLYVSTRKDCLLLAVNEKDETLWKYNADHLKRWSAEHARQLQRFSEDQKYENRPVPTFADRRKAMVEKFRDRMNSATHEIAAQLAGYALRRKFAVVRLDESEHGYCEQFPWFRLRSLITEKLDEAGIRLELKSPEEKKLP